MKSVKYRIFFTAIVSVLFLTACLDIKDSEEIDLNAYKLIAWNSLTIEAQQTVTHDWQEAEASIIQNPDDVKKNIVLVVFHTINDILTCPIHIYIRIDTKEIYDPQNINYYCN